MAESVDVVVLGAGPAGGSAALSAAQRGASVVLLDKAVLPRDKVCGCCLHATAVEALERVDVTLPRGDRAELEQTRLWAAGRCAELDGPGGLVVSRRALDQRIVESAMNAGAVAHFGRSAKVIRWSDDADRVAHEVQAGDRTWRTRVLIVATGLGGGAMRGMPGGGRWTPRRASRIGVGGTTPRPVTPCGVLEMCCGSSGYVGAVALADGRGCLAAAVSPEALRRAGGPGALLGEIAGEAGATWAGAMEAVDWSLTPRLTGRGPLCGPGVVVVGDAAGYVEPFTGEGMTWAIAGGLAAGRLGTQGLSATELQRAWEQTHRRLVSRRQWRCRALGWALRRPRLVRSAVRVLAQVPQASGWMMPRGVPATPVGRLGVSR
jgi:flavin-dependent dehydrogenase